MRREHAIEAVERTAAAAAQAEAGPASARPDRSAPSPATLPPDAPHRAAPSHRAPAPHPASSRARWRGDRACRRRCCLGLKPAQVLAVTAASFLADCADQAANRFRAGLADGALDRHADAHPAVVIEIGVRDPGERRAHRLRRALLRMAGAGFPAACQRCRLELLRQQRDGLVEKRARLRLIDRRQAAEIELSEVLFRPLVWAAGARDGWRRRRTAGPGRAPPADAA